MSRPLPTVVPALVFVLGLGVASGIADAQGKPPAEEALRERIERTDSVHARTLLARLHLTAGRPDLALEPAAEALRRAPNSEDLLALYARTALAARRPVRALFPLEALVRMVPESPDYPYLLGVARMQVGLLPEAEDVLNRAARSRGDHVLTHIALGLVRNRSKQYDRAAKALERALLLDPENPEALGALAEAYAGLDDPERAEALAHRALARRPGDPTAQLALGRVRMGQGRFKEARDAFRRAIESAPDSAPAHYQLSLALARLGDREGSRRHRELYGQAQRALEAHLLEVREVPPSEDP